jgi:hypothetical protein
LNDLHFHLYKSEHQGIDTHTIGIDRTSQAFNSAYNALVKIEGENMSPLNAVLKIVKDSKGTGNFKSYAVSLAQTSKNWRNSRVRFNRTDWQTWKGID